MSYISLVRKSPLSVTLLDFEESYSHFVEATLLSTLRNLYLSALS